MLGFKNDSGKVASQMASLMGLAPILAVGLAIGMVVLTTSSIQGFFATKADSEQKGSLPKFVVNQRPVGLVAYERYAQVLDRLSKDISVKGTKEGINIVMSNAANYPEFMFILSSIQGLSNKVIWQADSICLGRCSGGAGSALVKGFEEGVSVSLRKERS